MIKDCDYWDYPNRCFHKKRMELLYNKVYLQNCNYTNSCGCELYEKRGDAP